MLTVTEIFTIIITHFIADFIFQDEKWALGKSKNWGDLLSHTITYSVIWVFVICLLFGLNNTTQTTMWYVTHSFAFGVVTLICHTATDYVTSRIVSKKFANGEYGSSIPNFGAFTIIGIDQVLHYVQLFLTYNLLK
jgi:hypothetical protein